MAHKVDFKNATLFVNLARVGNKLKEVEARFLRHPFGELTPTWYRASDDVEFMLFRDPQKELVKVLINIHGLLFVWSRAVGLRTGHIRSRHGLRDVFYDRTAYTYDQRPNPLTLKLAGELIKLASQIKSGHNEWIDKTTLH